MEQSTVPDLGGTEGIQEGGEQILPIPKVYHNKVVIHSFTSTSDQGVVSQSPPGSPAEDDVDPNHQKCAISVEGRVNREMESMESVTHLPNHWADSESVINVNTTTSTSPSPSASSNSSIFQYSQPNWLEVVFSSILPVRCKRTNGELHRNKFVSGHKGRCIKSGPGDGEWYTPAEFEAVCGRGNSKDWKRSIQSGGRSLGTLISKGVLVPHAPKCSCSRCIEGASEALPFMPFKHQSRKRKSTSCSETDNNSVPKPGTSAKLTAAPIAAPTSICSSNINHPHHHAEENDMWNLLESTVDQVISAAGTVKTLVQEMKERTIPETTTTAIEVEIPSRPAGAVQDPKCDNCGRECVLECSGCHRVRYCSAFCQQKDWPNHHTACGDVETPST